MMMRTKTPRHTQSSDDLLAQQPLSLPPFFSMAQLLSPSLQDCAEVYQVVYARWSGYVDGDPTSPKDFASKAHAYTVVRRPSRPLQTGMKVRIYATTPEHLSSPAASQKTETYDPHVTGTLTRVLGWRGWLVGFEVENECRANLVRRVRLEVPCMEGKTVRLANGKLDRGPKPAPDMEMRDDGDTIPPPSLWQCGGRSCLAGAPRAVGPGIFYVASNVESYEEEDGQTRASRTAQRRRPHGPLAALGWTE